MTESDKNPFLGLGIKSSFTSFSREKVASGIDCEGLPSGRYIDFSARKTFSVSGQETTPRGIYVSPDGSKMYTSGQSGDGVDEYTLSTPYDPTSATATHFFATGSQDLSPTDLFFKPDGTKMFVLGDWRDEVYEYHLSTAWDLSTASYDSNYDLGTNTNIMSPRGLYFSPDGTKMLIFAAYMRYIVRYTLSTPWDVSTAGSKYANNFIATEITGTGSEGGLWFNPEGTRMVICTTSNDLLLEYSLPNAYDIGSNSVSYIGGFSIGSINAFPVGLCWGSNGKYLYLIGSSPDTIDRFETCTDGAYKMLGRP